MSTAGMAPRSGNKGGPGSSGQKIPFSAHPEGRLAGFWMFPHLHLLEDHKEAREAEDWAGLSTMLSGPYQHIETLAVSANSMRLPHTRKKGARLSEGRGPERS